MLTKRWLVAGILVLASAGVGAGGETQGEQITVPLTAPDKPGKLILERHQGSISVKGYEGAAVVVKATFRNPDGAAFSEANSRTMKPIAAAAIQLDAQEADNVVNVDAHTRTRSIDLAILVPFRFSVKLSVKDGGDVDVEGLRGDAEIDNPFGSVRLDRMTGSANVNSVDGDITAQFLGLAAGVPLAFTTVHGKVEVTFPSDANLTVRMKSDEGMVYSDFDIQVEKRTARTEPAAKTGGTRVALDEWTTGRIGRGGTNVLLKSYDGNITIRRNLLPRPL